MLCMLIFVLLVVSFLLLMFLNETTTTAIYTLSLHDALPICARPPAACASRARRRQVARPIPLAAPVIRARTRSEEHTSELQSRRDLVCRLLLEKKNTEGRKSNDSHADCYQYFWVPEYDTANV